MPSLPVEEASQTIRSIHDLRAAGHKNRFMDDVVPLVNDIKTPKQSSRSQRRSALMELCNNFADKGWASRFIEYGFDSDLFGQFDFAGIDPIANVLLCVVSHDCSKPTWLTVSPTNSSEQVFWHSCPTVLKRPRMSVSLHATNGTTCQESHKPISSSSSFVSSADGVFGL